MWRDNMRIWMRWVHEYAARGGNVTVGSDAGFIYHLYGFVADLAIVDGNPLHNLKVFYGTGVDVERNGKIEHRGGVRYTIKQGIVFDAQQLLADVRRMVEDAKRT